MTPPPRSARLLASAVIVLGLAARPGPAADDPPRPPSTVPAPQAALPDPSEGGKSIVPTPQPAIPDDPPPHEGALFDLPIVIEPPDILVVEVLEALPGRPITGERLVRADGTISLGFYGDIHVRGLTVEQAKVKILLHLRRFLNDQSLGLVEFRPVEIEGEMNDDAPPRPPAPGADGDKVLPDPPATLPPSSRPADLEAPPAAQQPGRPSARRVALQIPKAETPRQAGTPPAGEQRSAPRSKPEVEIVELDDGMGLVAVANKPAASSRVFVDIASHNTKAYYVTGDVGSPGRLPFTGGETVLDAINYAGGFIPTAEPADIHLYRPPHAGKPARDYPIDYAAILKGDSRANLQVFPGDRLVVGRNPVVKKTIEIDRAMAPVNSMMSASLHYATLARSLGLSAGEINGTTQASRDQSLGRFFDYLWNLPGGKADNFDLKKYFEVTPAQPGPTAAPSPAVPR